MRITDFFKEDNGKYSSTRLVFVVATLSVFGVWGVICLKQWALLDIPTRIAIIITGLTGGKLASRKIENGGRGKKNE